MGGSSGALVDGGTVPILAALLVLAASVQVRPETLEDWERYVTAVERRFLDEVEAAGDLAPTERLSGEDQRRLREVVTRGEVFSSREVLRVPDGDDLDIRGGSVQHVRAVVFIPATGLPEVLKLLQDYGGHAAIEGLDLERSELLARDGDRFTFRYRLHRTSPVDVAFEATFQTDYVSLSARHAYSISRTVEIHEVERVGGADERLLPDGEGNGYLWRSASYWRYLERDGGVWIEAESVNLAKKPAFWIRWLAGGVTVRAARDSLAGFLAAIRRQLAPAASPNRPRK